MYFLTRVGMFLKCIPTKSAYSPQSELQWTILTLTDSNQSFLVIRGEEEGIADAAPFLGSKIILMFWL
jgi:hypothetical protein